MDKASMQKMMIAEVNEKGVLRWCRRQLAFATSLYGAKVGIKIESRFLVAYKNYISSYI